MHHYTLPVRHAIDAIRNCAHCRWNTDGDCLAWDQVRKCVAEVRDVTGGCTATTNQFADGSVVYLALDAPDWQEADELKGTDLERALGILQASPENPVVTGTP